MRLEDLPTVAAIWSMTPQGAPTTRFSTCQLRLCMVGWIRANGHAVVGAYDGAVCRAKIALQGLKCVGPEGGVSAACLAGLARAIRAAIEASSDPMNDLGPALVWLQQPSELQPHTTYSCAPANACTQDDVAPVGRAGHTGCRAKRCRQLRRWPAWLPPPLPPKRTHPCLQAPTSAPAVHLLHAGPCLAWLGMVRCHEPAGKAQPQAGVGCRHAADLILKDAETFCSSYGTALAATKLCAAQADMLTRRLRPCWKAMLSSCARTMQAPSMYATHLHAPASA